MFQLQIRELAKVDIQEIIDFYNENTSSLITDKFIENLFIELEFIKNNPTSFQIKYKKSRVRYIKNFPFGIHYRIKENFVVEILAVLHTSRNPKTWKRN